MKGQGGWGRGGLNIPKILNLYALNCRTSFRYLSIPCNAFIACYNYIMDIKSESVSICAGIPQNKINNRGWSWMEGRGQMIVDVGFWSSKHETNNGWLKIKSLVQGLSLAILNMDFDQIKRD